MDLFSYLFQYIIFFTGYTNPVLSQNFSEITNTIPQSPPPSYEHVLEEVSTYIIYKKKFR